MNQEELIRKIEELQLTLDRTKRIIADKNNLLSHANFRISELNADTTAYLETIYPLLELYKSIPEEMYDEYVLLEYPEREVVIGKKKVMKPPAKLTYGHLKDLWNIWSRPSGHILLDKVSKLKRVYEAANLIDFQKILHFTKIEYTPEDSVEILPELEKIRVLEEALALIDVPNICCVSEYSKNQATKCNCHSALGIFTEEPQKEQSELSEKLSASIGEITVYTDGACSGNPGPGGYAFVIENKDKNVKTGSGYGGDDVTNNQMELLAVYKALEYLVKHDIRPEIIRIISDSSYVIDGMNKWIQKWITYNWFTATNKPVANNHYWKSILDKLKYYENVQRPPKIIWQHTLRNVFSQQKECDLLAKKEISDHGRF